MSLKPTIIYAFAAFYLIVLTYGFLFTGDPPRVSNQDFFSQAALVLAAVGLYNTAPPGK